MLVGGLGFSSNSPKAKYYRASFISTAWLLYFPSWYDKHILAVFPSVPCSCSVSAVPPAVMRLLRFLGFLLLSAIVPLVSYTTFLVGKGVGRSENCSTCLCHQQRLCLQPFVSRREGQMTNGVRLAQCLDDIHGNYSSLIAMLRSCAVSHAVLPCQEIYFNRSL